MNDWVRTWQEFAFQFGKPGWARKSRSSPREKRNEALDDRVFNRACAFLEWFTRARCASQPGHAVHNVVSTVRSSGLVLGCCLAAFLSLSATAQIQQAWVARYNNG